jgi:hypothetical protein
MNLFNIAHFKIGDCLLRDHLALGLGTLRRFRGTGGCVPKLGDSSLLLEYLGIWTAPSPGRTCLS